MPVLPQQPTLADFQRYVTELEHERGFQDQDVLQKCLMLGEEVGELFKAIRKLSKMGIDAKSKVGTAAEELADVLIYLCAIANRLDIPLEQAFRDKEAVNHTRTWSR